jgi:hypothetical protein
LAPANRAQAIERARLLAPGSGRATGRYGAADGGELNARGIAIPSGGRGHGQSVLRTMEPHCAINSPGRKSTPGGNPKNNRYNPRPVPGMRPYIARRRATWSSGGRVPGGRGVPPLACQLDPQQSASVGDVQAPNRVSAEAAVVRRFKRGPRAN